MSNPRPSAFILRSELGVLTDDESARRATIFSELSAKEIDTVAAGTNNGFDLKVDYDVDEIDPDSVVDNHDAPT